MIGLFGLIGFGLFPWTIWLSASLKAHHETRHWDLAWSGFDSALALAFLLTALAAWRRSPWVGALAAATGDAARHRRVVRHRAREPLGRAAHVALSLAAFAELPLAALCFWIAYRTERFLARVEQALHLTSAAESPTQRDLIGVLEVTPDGQPAREPRDADAPA